MNCKPNGLARVIDCPETRAVEAVDKIIRVTHTFADAYGSVYWAFEGGPIQCWAGPITGFSDLVLRPIDGGETPEESAEAMRLLTHIPQKVTA